MMENGRVTIMRRMERAVRMLAHVVEELSSTGAQPGNSIVEGLFKFYDDFAS